METEQQSLPRQFFEELKRRRVIRVATIYVLALWPIIQIMDILAPAIGLPVTAMRYLLIIFVGGLPVALILSWLYDLNQGGIVRTTESSARPGHALVSRSTEITVVSVLILAIAVLFFLQSTLEFEEPAPPPLETAAEPGITSIAVLPFVSFSQSREDELFSDGLTEELLNVLSQIKYLRVIARTTSFAYKGVSKNVQEIGSELGVDTILEGSVRRNDVENTIRVTAQLIDTSTGTHLWSNTFDREFRDIFKIQDEISAAVVSQLNVTLAEEEQQRLQSRATANPDAMVAFGMGRAAIGRRTPQSLRDAERYFQEAIDLDPGYVDAYAELASAYALQADFESGNRAAQLELAQSQADIAMSLDEESGAAWAAQGLINMIRAEADPEFKDPAIATLARAMELNPSLPMANMWYGNLMDDPAERRRYHQLAFELDPRSPVAGYNLANDLMLEGREAESMEVFSKIVEADPNYPNAYALIANMNEFRGRLGEAIRNWEKVYDLQPTGPTAAKLASLWIDIGDLDEAGAWLGRAEDNPQPGMENELTWLRISIATAKGDRAAAEELMQSLLQPSSDDPMALVNAARAGYFLGDFERAVAAYEQLGPADLSTIAHQTNEVDLLETRIAVAFAYRQLGRSAESEVLLDDAAATVQKFVSEQPRVNPNVWFALAQVNAIRGENNLALIHLQRAVDEGWRQHWRPAVEPNLASLTLEPAFGAMMQGLTTRMDLIREQIAFDQSFERDWRS
jgi:TolB-like protein/tetratricopeptide (TPR) repeat protein